MILAFHNITNLINIWGFWLRNFSQHPRMFDYRVRWVPVHGYLQAITHTID